MPTQTINLVAVLQSGEGIYVESKIFRKNLLDD
jgi:hypothetical protein